MSVANDILTEIAERIAAINGVSPYTHNLSGSGAVVIGRRGPGAGVIIPGAWIAVASVATAPAPTLGRYRRTMTIDIEALAQSASAGVSRHAAALSMLDDLLVALEAGRVGGSHQALDGLVLDVTAEGATFDGDEIGMPQAIGAMLTVSVYWDADSGVGL